MTERDFTHPKNTEDLDRLLERLRRINKRIGVNETKFAGILPGFLTRRGYDVAIEVSYGRTVETIYQSLQEVSKWENLGENIPIILIGGRGELGKRLHSFLSKIGYEQLYVVDPKLGIESLPEALREKRAVLLDVSRKNVVRQYIDQMWSEIVFINETFPEPSRNIVARLMQKGIHAYHISGVWGRVIPSLPHGYKNSVPCCAVHTESDDSRPIVLKLEVSD